VIAQTYDNWEMFIIDDCSSDNSAQLIEQYQSNKIKIFQAKENRGPIFTFNQLLEKAQGVYVAILGSDDV
jgi:Glycosyltransferases involved in cell wall biogenesis